MLLYLAAFFLPLCVSAIDLRTTSTSCTKAAVVEGVPTDVSFENSSPTTNLSEAECITKCCSSEQCDVAGIHKKFCVFGTCNTTPCNKVSAVDPGDRTARFTFVERKANTPRTEKPATTKIPNNGSLTQPKNPAATAPKNPAATVPHRAATAAPPKVVTAAKVENKAQEVPPTTAAQNKTTAKVEEKCNLTCPANSTCLKKTGNWTCECNKGFTLKAGKCDPIAVCTTTSCGTNYACSVVDNSVKCACKEGYKANKDNSICEQLTCKGVPCPLHASCRVSGNSAKCFCDHDFLAQENFCRPVVQCTIEPKNSGCPTNERCQQVSGKLGCYCVPGKVRVKDAGDCTGNASRISIAGQDVTVQMPAETATLNVVVSPAHPKTLNYYSYLWAQKSSPENAKSGLDGLTNPQVTIKKLAPGEYIFNVEVVGKHNEFSSKVVKLVVKPEAKKNEPPLAVIKPGGNMKYKLPATFSLNGISSKDDKKIVSYKWTIDSRPVIASNDHVKLEGENTDTLKVTVQEGVGKFQFKLEVKDKEGLTNSSTQIVNIEAEDDNRPSAKVSAPLTLTLPHNSATLLGNGSRDDHGIVRWEWAKSGDSPKAGDMTGTTTDTLSLSNLAEGTYTFTLTVYDKKKQASTASTTVTIRPAKIGPPTASAGNDKELVSPDTSTVLDGSKSTSPIGPLTYTWEKIAGDNHVVLGPTNSTHLDVEDLSIGTYRFKLTVTDAKNISASDEVTVVVKEDDNQPPKAVVPSTSITLYLPNRAVDVDGSGSSDDKKIVEWRWSRSSQSPALGQVVSGSDKTDVLKLCDLIVGKYNFTLTVKDEKGLSDSASVTVTVEKNPHSQDIVQVFLFEDPASFTQEKLEALRGILMVPLTESYSSVNNGKARPRAAAAAAGKWELVTISVTSIDNRVVVYFYGKSENGDILPGKPLVKQLRDTVYGELLGYNFDVIDTSTCSNGCSGHGVCSDETRLCTCDEFWMENFFRASAGRQFSNCDWSKIYFGIVVLMILCGLFVVLYVVYYVMSLRNDQIKRRRRYKRLEEETAGRDGGPLDSTDDDEFFRSMKMKRVGSAPNGYTGASFSNSAANVLNANNFNNGNNKKKSYQKTK